MGSEKRQLNLRIRVDATVIADNNVGEVCDERVRDRADEEETALLGVAIRTLAPLGDARSVANFCVCAL